MRQASPVRPPEAAPPCPYCRARTRVGVHSRQDGRYRCHTCRRTFTQSHGTPLYGLKTDLNIVVLVVTLLIFGCPLPAIVMAFKIDERTLADWLDKAGEHAQRVQDYLVCQGQLNLGQVQADELWCRSQRGVLWLATAMSVASRLLLRGSVASGRTEAMITEVMRHVHRAARLQSPILWATDGFPTWSRFCGASAVPSRAGVVDARGWWSGHACAQDNGFFDVGAPGFSLFPHGDFQCARPSHREGQVLEVILGALPLASVYSPSPASARRQEQEGLVLLLSDDRSAFSSRCTVERLCLNLLTEHLQCRRDLLDQLQGYFLPGLHSM